MSLRTFPLASLPVLSVVAALTLGACSDSPMAPNGAQPTSLSPAGTADTAAASSAQIAALVVASTSGATGGVSIPTPGATCLSFYPVAPRTVTVSGWKISRAPSLILDQEVQAEIWLELWVGNTWQYVANIVVVRTIPDQVIQLPDIKITTMDTNGHSLPIGYRNGQTLPSGYYKVEARFSWWAWYGNRLGWELVTLNSATDYFAPNGAGPGWCKMN